MSGALRVVVHEATRTGAPIVLLALLRHSRRTLDLPVDVRIVHEGPLSSALRQQGDGPSDLPPLAVIVNSCLSAREVLGAPPGTPTAVYVHEAGATIRGLASDCRAGLRAASQVWAVSAGAVEDLVDCGVARARIRLLPPVVTTPRVPAAAAIASHRAALGADRSIPLLLGCGEAAWRKGPDLWVATIAEVRRRRKVAAAWVGRRFAGEIALLDHDTRTLGLDPVVRWIGEVDRTAPFLVAADVVVMTSRDDPMPLVPMEAALAGTPTAAFAVGGLADLGDASAVATATYPDTVALADEIESLLDDSERRRDLVRRCAVLAADRSVSEIGPLFDAAVTDLVSADQRRTAG